MAKIILKNSGVAAEIPTSLAAGELAINYEDEVLHWLDASSTIRETTLNPAPLDSPDFVGTPTAPTAAGADSSTKIATTAFVQGEISGKQGADATLSALAGFNTNGLLTQTAPDTFAGRVLTGTSGEIEVDDGDGVSGNPTVSLPATVVLTGKAVTDGTFNNPTLASAQLGTPDSGVLTNCSGLPVAGISGLGTGVGTLLGSATGAKASLVFVIGDGIATITTGLKGFLSVDFACTITGWALFGDATGSIQLDLWKDVYANFPPTVADTITASAKPLFSSAVKGKSSTLTGWTTSIAAGDVIGVKVDSITTCKQVTLVLEVTRI